MNRQIKSRLYWLPVLLCAFPFLIVACGDSEPEHIRLSEKPAAGAEPGSGTADSPQLQARDSELGMRVRVSYDELNQLAQRIVPETQQDEGSQKFCERVLGFKVCGRARWVYRLQRTGAVTVAAATLPTGNDDIGRINIGIPFEFAGNAGMKGDLAKALRLEKIDFNGALDVNVLMAIDLDSDWCPLITTQVQYHWTRSPRVEWVGGLDFNVRDILDKQLSKQLESLDQRIAESIDCERFRGELATQWRSYSFGIDLPAELQIEPANNNSATMNNEQPAADPASMADDFVPEPAASDGLADAGGRVSDSSATEGQNKMFLNLVPSGFAFSGINPESDRLGVSFVLRAKASVDAQALPETQLELPAVERVAYAAGSTRFDFLVLLGYAQLQGLAREALANQQFESATPAGDVSVTIKDVEVFPSGELLTVGLEFDADLPTSRKRKVPGKVYLTTRPVVDSNTRTLSLSDIRFSTIVDNTVWNLLANVFEKKIVNELQSRSMIDLQPHLTELEISLLAQLSDTNKTRGAIVQARDLSVDLEDIVATDDALAIRVRVSSLFDIDLPVSVFENLE